MFDRFESKIAKCDYFRGFYVSQCLSHVLGNNIYSCCLYKAVIIAKSFLKLTRLAYANKTKECITSQKLGSCDFSVNCQQFSQQR